MHSVLEELGAKENFVEVKSGVYYIQKISFSLLLIFNMPIQEWVSL